MTIWYVPEDRRLIWYEREGEAVVFNSCSGRSHFLNTITNEVLRYIEAEPRSAQDVLAHIEEILDGEEIANLDQQIRTIISGFERQGLVDPWQG